MLTATDTFESFLQELAVLAAREVGGELSCGITARSDRRPVTVASSDALAARLDEMQYSVGTGPCMHAMNTGEVVVIEDLVSDERWSVEPRTFSAEHRRRAARFADRAAGALTVATRMAAHVRLNEQLQQAVESRAVIDKAIGAIMTQRRCSPEQAFAVLRATSQNRNIRMRTLAADIVASIQLQAPHHPDGTGPGR